MDLLRDHAEKGSISLVVFGDEDTRERHCSWVRILAAARSEDTNTNIVEKLENEYHSWRSSRELGKVVTMYVFVLMVSC